MLRFALLLTALVLAQTAHADAPLFVSPSIGLGFGGATIEGRGGGGAAYQLGLDLGWRRNPQSAYLIQLSIGGVNGPTHIPEVQVVEGVGYGSALVGLERSKNRPGWGSYAQLGIGLGALGHQTYATSDMASPSNHTSIGLALGAGAGGRIISPAQQLGFDFGLRLGSVLSGSKNTVTMAFVLGVIAHPR
jgi:hypothetical protein